MAAEAGLHRLRPYQVAIASAILRSVRAGQGHSLSVMVARQGGKNEVSAQVEFVLLLAFARKGGTIIKTAPTLHPQLEVSRRRLLDCFRRAGLEDKLSIAGPHMSLLNSSITFLSGHPDANVVGHTASLLLEVDEAHEMDADNFERDFRPMVLATGATTVFYGTAWEPDSLLERVKADNLALEREDGLCRHFEYDYVAVSRDFPEYLPRVEAQRRLLGAQSPIFLSQYQLIPQEGIGRLLTREHLDSLRGDHDELRAGELDGAAPAVAGRFVAGLDIAGDRPGDHRDRSVLTVARLRTVTGETPPRIEVVKHFAWQAGWDSVQEEIRRAHALFRFELLVVDATGMGMQVASQLEATLGRSVVKRFTFTSSSKSALGYELVSALAAGRVRMYREENAHSRQFWLEAEHIRRRFPGPTELMTFEAAPGGHDDYIISLALCVHAANQARPRSAYGFTRD
jgi:hypothetical protein